MQFNLRINLPRSFEFQRGKVEHGRSHLEV